MLRCQASLADGAHDLTFIGVYGARAVSQTVSINSDCSPPQITDIQIPEDADGNDCVSATESLAGAPEGSGQFTLAVTTTGLEDGAEVEARTVGNSLLGSGTVTAGVASITISLTVRPNRDHH